MDGDNKVTLLFPSEDLKKAYSYILRDEVKIPVCKNCGKFFSLGFPSNEDGLSDYLICSANDLLCDCIHNDVVNRLMKQKGDSLIDISQWYRVLSNR